MKLHRRLIGAICARIPSGSKEPSHHHADFLAGHASRQVLISAYTKHPQRFVRGCLKPQARTSKNAGLRTNPIPKGSPHLNGRCERVIETIKLECLAKSIVFGKRHMGHLISEFTTYYNTRRSHRARENLPPIRDVPALGRDLALPRFSTACCRKLRFSGRNAFCYIRSPNANLA
jgi:hypothetical protein